MNTHDNSADGALPRAADGHDQHKVAVSRSKWVFGGFIAIALLMLAVEHRTHLLSWVPSWWPWLFLLACPLMHVFMHGGHGGHGNRDAQGNISNKAEDK
jgi:hypothetical protein